MFQQVRRGKCKTKPEINGGGFLQAASSKWPTYLVGGKMVRSNRRQTGLTIT